MSHKGWQGEAEMQSALDNLINSNNNEKSIKHVVATAFKLQKEFKLVVYTIEMFIKKSKPDDKLGGLFVLDALCRDSRAKYGKEKDIFSNRFKLRLKETISFLEKVNSKDKSAIARLIDEWKKLDMFPLEMLSGFKFEKEVLPMRPSFGLSPSDSPDHDSPEELYPIGRSGESSDAAVPGVSLGSFTAVSSTANVTTAPKGIAGSESGGTKDTQQESLHALTIKAMKDLRKAVRQCPFREGNCLFSDKCRFSHTDTNTLQTYSNSRMAAKFASNTSRGLHKRTSNQNKDSKQGKRLREGDQSVSQSASSVSLSSDTLDRRCFPVSAMHVVLLSSNLCLLSGGVSVSDPILGTRMQPPVPSSGGGKSSSGGSSGTESNLSMHPSQLTIHTTHTSLVRSGALLEETDKTGHTDLTVPVPPDYGIERIIPKFQRVQYSGDGSLKGQTANSSGTNADDSLCISIPCSIVTLKPEIYSLSRLEFNRLLM